MGTLASMGVALFAIWWWLDSKMERTFDTLDRKSDALNAVLRDILLKFMGESGEVRGGVCTRTPSQD